MAEYSEIKTNASVKLALMGLYPRSRSILTLSNHPSMSSPIHSNNCGCVKNVRSGLSKFIRCHANERSRAAIVEGSIALAVYQVESTPKPSNVLSGRRHTGMIDSRVLRL